MIGEATTPIGPIISFIFALVIVVVFLTAIIMIVVGILGTIVSIIKHSPKDRWVGLLKKGLIIFVVNIVLFVAINVVLSALGFEANSSFTGDTQVLTPNGKVKISDLNEGDKVLSFNTKTKTVTTKKIEKYRSHEASSYYIINDSLKVTSEHPFAVKHSENIVWKKVKDLVVGDQLVTRGAIPTVIETIKEVSIDKAVVVYNPQVSGEHNYFVVAGNDAVLVHNKLRIPKLDEQ